MHFPILAYFGVITDWLDTPILATDHKKANKSTHSLEIDAEPGGQQVDEFSLG